MFATEQLNWQMHFHLPICAICVTLFCISPKPPQVNVVLFCFFRLFGWVGGGGGGGVGGVVPSPSSDVMLQNTHKNKKIETLNTRKTGY